MKSVYVFCTKWYVFLTEIPLAALLALTIYYNKYADNLVKFYPLISYDEIRYIGIFSSRDKAVINKDKTVIINFLSYGRIKVRLFGSDGKAPLLDWAQNDENYTPVDIFLFRGKGVGGQRAVRRILKYFEVPKDEQTRFINEDFSAEYMYSSISSSIVDDNREIRIRITETV